MEEQRVMMARIERGRGWGLEGDVQAVMVGRARMTRIGQLRWRREGKQGEGLVLGRNRAEEARCLGWVRGWRSPALDRDGGQKE